MTLGTLTDTEIAQRISRLDASGRSLYQLCPRKFFYRYVLGLVPARDEGQGSWARDFGTAVHAAMEYDELDDAIIAFHNAYDKDYNKGTKGPSAEQVDEARANPYASRSKAHVHAPDRGELLLAGYWAKYRAHDAFVVHEREKRLKMPMGTGRTYFGRVDCILSWVDAPETRLHSDYRTTAGRGASSMVTDPMPQQEGYIVLCVANGLIEASDSHEFIMDVMSKDSTLDGHKYKDGSAFERCHEARTSLMLIYWAEETTYIWNDIYTCANRGVWPMAASSACMAFNTPCPYLAICRKRGDEEAQQELCDPAANELYEVEPWQPLEGFDL